MISILFTLMLATEPKLIVAANGAKPAGPYSPALQAQDFIYVSGQGVRDSQGKMPDGIDAQARQCVENVKALLDAAGASMKDVTAAQFFLLDMKHRPLVEKLWAEHGGTPVKESVWLGVARMPTDTTVEITVYARKGTAGKSSRSVVNYVDGAGSDGVVGVAALGGGAKKASLALRVGPAPAVYCPVVTGDASTGGVEEQTKSAFAKLQSCLEKNGTTLAKVVATNVYVDNIDDFAKMNAVYATYFPGVKPTRTTVQPLAPGKAPGKVRIAALALR